VDRLRIDLWLWYARFFKTRSLAANNVRAGHVRLNGARTKAAHEVRVGDALAIVRGSDKREVIVARLPERRGPAPEGETCWVETDASLERRTVRAAQRASSALRAPTSGRPDKRTRRLIRRQQRDPLIPE
jgi:ribosome-associated heat shock protein Hsp15